nr:bifunctional ornithine acetyltransferase/N-acetylglutamate synthase [Evansella halocellulosilytica]
MVSIKSSDEKIIHVKEGTITEPKGFRAAGIYTGVKRKRLDLGMIFCDVPASSAAVYTLNKVQAAPLKVTKESIAKEGKLSAVVVNSGNANACTGKKGLEDAYEMRKLTAETFSVPENQVAVSSTGVIGEYLQMDKITKGISQLSPLSSPDGADQFSESILTTDTLKKHACYQVMIDGVEVTIAGVAKGSGMIHPNMATMLAFITTDAKIEPEILQHALAGVTDESFNQITVDGDTSTNDMVVAMASGLAENKTLTKDHPDWSQFILALKTTCEDLAKKIARDGEGATKLIEANVIGAKSNKEASMVAKQIVGSDLVKSAIYGTDANWGRIICAVGYSGADIDSESIDIMIGPIKVLENSRPLNFSEELAKRYLQNEYITIYVNCNVGDGFSKAWGCDLTYDYVRINAGYRT